MDQWHCAHAFLLGVWRCKGGDRPTPPDGAKSPTSQAASVGVGRTLEGAVQHPPGDQKAKLGSLLGLDGGSQPQAWSTSANGGGGSSQGTRSLNQPVPQETPKDPLAPQRVDRVGVPTDQEGNDPAKQSNPTPRGNMNKNNNKCPWLELEEGEADPTEPGKKAFKNAPKGPKLLEGLTIPSGLNVNTTVKLSLSCLNEAVDGSFCLSSPKGSSKAKGDSEDTKAKEENLEEEDDQNPDEGWDEAEDVNADDDDDFDTQDDLKSKPGQMIGSVSIVKKEGNNGNGATQVVRNQPKREKSFSKLVKECHYKKFLADTEEANLMKCALLSLGEEESIPSQDQIDKSCLFEQWPSDKNAAIEDISEYWLPILKERFLLTEEAPSDVMPEEGHTLLYTYESLMRLHPSAAGAWAEGAQKPAFVAVMPAFTPLPLRRRSAWSIFIL